MTDDEARTILHEMRYQPSARMAEAVCHALVAIADRKTLCDAIYAYGADAGVSANRDRNAARRHMKGEE